MNKKEIARILNLIIAAVCVVAIVLYFTLPLFVVSMTYTINADTMQTVVAANVGEKTQKGTTTLSKRTAVPLASSDYKGSLSSLTGYGFLADYMEDDIDISFDLQFPSGSSFFSDTLGMLSDKSKASTVIENLINDNVETVVAQITAALTEVVNDAVKGSIGQAVWDVIVESVTDYLNANLEENETEYTESDVESLLAQAGVTEEYLSEKIQPLIDAIYEGNATLSNVCNLSIQIVEEVYSMLSASDMEEFDGIMLSDDYKETISDLVAEVLELFAEEDGTLKSEEFTGKILLDILKSINSSSETDAKTDVKTISVKPLADETGALAVTTTSSELQSEMTTLLTNVLADMDNVIVYAYLGIVVLLLISLISWIYLLVKIIVKLPAKNPTIKLKAPIILGWIPFLIAVALTLVSLFMVPLFVEGLSLSLASTSGIFAAIAAVVLVVIWVPYASLRKSMKQEIEAETKA